MKRLLLVAAVPGLVAALPVRAEDAALSLTKAAEASRGLTYQGVAVYRGGEDELQVFKVQHRSVDGHERERIETMTGDPVQLLRTDDRMIWVLPKGRTVSQERPILKGVLNQLTAERVQQLNDWYRFVDEGPGRIADRACDGVMVAPRDAFRYGYEVWYDKDTRLPLKITLVGSQGEVLEQLMFTQISFPASIPDEAFQPQVDASKFNVVAKSVPPLTPLTPAASEAVDALPSQVSFGALPPGFKVVVREHRPLPNGQQGQMEHLMLSDGLASVSVFSAIRPSSPDSAKAFRGISHVGSVEAYGRMAGDYHITIVGEVPSATVRTIGDGISPILPADPGAAGTHAP